VSKGNTDLLLRLRKHYIHSTFIPNYVFLHSILYSYFYIYLVEQKKEKYKAVTVHAIQAYRGRRSILHLILDLDTIWK